MSNLNDEIRDVAILATVYLDECQASNVKALAACRTEQQRIDFGHRREQHRLNALRDKVNNVLGQSAERKYAHVSEPRLSALPPRSADAQEGH